MNKPASVNVPQLERILLGRWAEERVHSRKLAARDEMGPGNHLAMADHRQRVREQMAALVSDGMVTAAFPEKFGGKGRHGANVAAFEELIAADPSLQVKAGVQWGLFGSAILHLGNEDQHEAWLGSAIDLQVPGCFAMTETGHGSDVASVATTAEYLPDSDEFEINTPYRSAWKEYIGNAAEDGRAAVVFAQLITRGVRHGVHAFYVPIRDADGEFVSGVGGQDDGLKGGLGGVDNGRLHFTGVRVPRTNLLDRYGRVDAGGEYSSPIASPGRRFFTMLGTLVQGRVSLDGASIVAAKMGLAIAVRYADERRQFAGADPVEEKVLLDYQRHGRRLLPRLAVTYAAGFAHADLLDRFDDVFSGAHATDEDRQDLETLAAAYKPLSTWHAIDTLQEAREACGGAGYMAENRLVDLRADLDVYVTFEGDNTVLLQLVAKRLLADYSKEFKDVDLGGVARYMASQVVDRGVNRSGLRQLAQELADSGSRRRSAGQLREADTQRELLTARVETMVAELAGKLREVRRAAASEAERILGDNQDMLIEAARAHGELLRWEAFTNALDGIEDDGTRTVLTWLRDLYGLSLVEKHLSWYLMNGRLSMQRARTVGSYINRLVARLRPHAVDLVDAFGYGDELLRAPIASGAEAERQDESREYERRRRAAADAPVDEKVLRARAKRKAR
ncbi:acyl-CoA dehydrogenase family protein [Spelaeicoccus albus]|uniref:Acyl-CoA oxidase n=1 Tax=Spelaeicoccus albus TaxID=1280376 RepID=A0A7Z0D426_9MICO|nr:acyl-CoA dehydrogenase [Spelaeicoccus albus]NYI68468.1 acyl-CoA oxidase [Spelaeicoccus albus]